MIVGCKLLTREGWSLNKTHSRVRYPVGKWISVPGNGAYVAVTGGLNFGGTGPLLAYLECEEPTGARAPTGVICYRWVRRLAEPAPERVAPELRREIARFASGLTVEQRIALVRKSMSDWRGWAACYVPGVSGEQRVTFAMASTPYWRREVARRAPGLSDKQRRALWEADHAR